MKTIKLFAIIGVLFFVINCSNKKEKDLVSYEDIVEIDLEPNLKISLFERLGGENGISSIVDDIVLAHLDNPEIKHVFLPLKENPEKFESFKTHVKEFLSSGTGGGAVYTGKDLPSAHKGLNTTEKEFMAAVDDILAVLNKHNIDEETKKDMLYILYSMKGAVIGL